MASLLSVSLSRSLFVCKFASDDGKGSEMGIYREGSWIGFTHLEEF